MSVSNEPSFSQCQHYLLSLSSNMERRPVGTVTHFRVTQLIFVILQILYASRWPSAVAIAQELLIGFKATPDPSVSSFQPLLNDSSGNFSLGFLRVDRAKLGLAVIHLRSLEQLWQAGPAASSFPWSDRTQLFFNGSLVISDPHGGVFWSTGTEGDKVVLLDTSNLQVQKMGFPPIVLWQSFKFPTNTIVENQNFTSNMSLVSSSGLYSLRLGYDFMALYAKFKESTDQIYWKHKALEAKAKIVEGKGPIYARVNFDGFLGMYQTEIAPVDVQAFNSYRRLLGAFRIVRLEPDGNLKGYYWDGTHWVLDYHAIAETCELPNPCGFYGLCRPGSACSCLDNRTEFRSGECFAVQSGDFCSEGKNKMGNSFWVLRRRGVELPFKELMGYKTASSLEQCEGFCQSNCSCWGAVYNNASGFCYLVDYPIQTLMGVGDESKVGYFKVRKAAKRKMQVGFGLGIGFLCLAILLFIGAAMVAVHRIWKRRRGIKRSLEDGGTGGVSPGPYKELGSASFKSIEMCSRRQ